MNFRKIYPRVVIPYPIYLQNPYINNPSFYEPNTYEDNKNKDQRFIPFVGGALIGGVLGSAYSRPRYYNYPMYGGYGYGGYGNGYGSGAAIVLVLFILLVIIIGTRTFITA